MMLAKTMAIMALSELLKTEEKICEYDEELTERRIGLVNSPLRDKLRTEQEKLDELDDIMTEAIDKLDQFIKTME